MFVTLFWHFTFEHASSIEKEKLEVSQGETLENAQAVSVCTAAFHLVPTPGVSAATRGETKGEPSG